MGKKEKAAFIIWWKKSILGLPEYKYAWWNSRLQLIKQGKI
jgi:hypothetical protein